MYGTCSIMVKKIYLFLFLHIRVIHFSYDSIVYISSCGDVFIGSTLDKNNKVSFLKSLTDFAKRKGTYQM